MLQYLSHCDGGQWGVTDGPCQYLVIIILSYLAQERGWGGRGAGADVRRQGGDFVKTGGNGDVTQ